MKGKLLLIACCLLARGSLAVTGDILAAVVETNWILQTKIEGYNTEAGTNDQFNFGFGTNNSGISKVVLTMDTAGFNSEGNPTVHQRTVFGTKVIRMPYPYWSNLNTRIDGSDLWANQALSDFVYAGDTNLSLTVNAGWYSNSLAGTVVPTNLSTLEWPRPMAKWTFPPHIQAGSSFNATLIACHRSAANGLPVEAVRVRAVGLQSGQAVTNFARWACTYEPRTSPLGVWTTELSASLDFSGMTQGEVIVINADVYPRYGTNYKRSDDGVCATNDFACGFPPITVFCDRLGTFCSNWAMVDPRGSDSAGVITNGPFNQLDPTNCFLTINGAAARLAATNALAAMAMPHNDTAGGTIWLRGLDTNTSYAWVGGSSSYGTNGRTWTYIRKNPTNTLGQVIIGSQSGNLRLAAGGKILVDGVMWTNPVSTTVLQGIGDMWFTNCIFNFATDRMWAGVTNVYLTGNLITNMGSALRPFSGTTMYPVLVRGNDFTGLNNKGVLTFCFVGNYKGGKTVQTSPFLFWGRTTAGNTEATNSMVWCNFIGGLNGSQGGQYPLTNAATSLAFVQNVFEVANATAGPLLSIANDGSRIDQHNVILWHNTMVGERHSLGYNDVGTNPCYRYNWSVKNNIVDNLNVKSDTFTPTEGARIGNWPILYGVGWSGNMSLQTTNIGGSFNFGHEFIGLNSYQPATIPRGVPFGSPGVRSFAQFLNNASESGSEVGGGDYHLLPTSPCHQLATEYLLPYDLGGMPRTPVDNAPGVYAGDALPAVPTLTVQNNSEGRFLCWPAQYGGFALESCTDLSSTNWSAISFHSMILINSELRFPLSGVEPAALYRLRRP